MAAKQAKILIVAGSDSGGGAGIQADIKSASAMGVYAATAITSITAQNTMGVQAISDVPLDIVRTQIESVMEDIGAHVVKTGMLSSREIIELVAAAVNKYPADLVVDPVMVSKSGAKLLQDDAIDALKKKLLPKAVLVTPNIPEAEVLTGMKINSEADMEAAARKIIADTGCNAVLLKGGHMHSDTLIDILVTSSGAVHKFHSKRIKTNNTHGTGCTYASAIAALVAKGMPLPKAVGKAHKYLHKAIINAREIGKGHSPVAHFYFLKHSSPADVLRNILYIIFMLIGLTQIVLPMVKDFAN